MTDAALDGKPKQRLPRERNSKRRAAAAHHSLAYRQRQREKGLPTGLQIDAMIGRVFVQNIVRPQGLKSNADDIPKLCELVAKRFGTADELQADLTRRVALRVERLRPVS